MSARDTVTFASVEDAVTAGYSIRCEWFALCDHPAVTSEPHPVLVAVPICARCLARVRSLS